MEVEAWISKGRGRVAYSVPKPSCQISLQELWLGAFLSVKQLDKKVKITGRLQVERNNEFCRAGKLEVRRPCNVASRFHMRASNDAVAGWGLFGRGAGGG